MLEFMKFRFDKMQEKEIKDLDKDLVSSFLKRA